MPKKSDLISVVGVPGVGKTSLCRKLSEKVDYPHINYGDLMLKIAKEKNFVETEDELFSLPIQIQHQIWKETALQIKKQKKALVDLHGLDQSPIGYILSLPIKIIKPSLIILIESPPELILFRRKLDPKERIKDTIKTLTEHIEMLRVSMIISSVMIGCTLSIIQNINFNETLNEMKRLVMLHQRTSDSREKFK